MAGYVSAARQSSRYRVAGATSQYECLTMNLVIKKRAAGRHLRQMIFDGKTTLKVVPIPGVLE